MENRGKILAKHEFTAARHDALAFYACTIASFLEDSVAEYVENLQPFFADDPETGRWLRETWLPEEEAHGRLTRGYVEATWPEFDWRRAYGAFAARFLPQCHFSKLRPSPALETLARCVTETESAMMYRCIARYTRDPGLRALFERLSRDEVRHYRRFRKLHQRLQMRERNSLCARLLVLVDRSRLVRDEDIALAFAPLNDAWRSAPPIPLWSNRQLLQRAAGAMKAHFPFDEARRMLFRPLGLGRAFERLAASLAGAWVARLFIRYA